MMASAKKSYPCSGPYPINVSAFPISSTASLNASTTAGTNGFVTSPIPILMIFASGFALINSASLLATSTKR